MSLKYSIIPLCVILFFCQSAIANTIDDYSTTKSSISEVRKEIKKEQKDLKSISKTKTSLNKKLGSIDKKIRVQKSQLSKLNKKIKLLKVQQTNIITEISKLQKTVDSMRESIKKSNSYIINNQGILELKVLLFSKTYHDTIKNMELIEHINKKIYGQILLIKKKNDEIFKLKSNLDMKVAEVKKISKMKKNVISEYKAEKTRYNQTLTLIKNDEADTKEYLKMLKQRKTSLDKSFRKLKKKINKEEGGEKLLSSPFFKLKGKHIWPIDGTIIESFGPKKLKGFKGTIYNKGIKIKADDAGYVHSIFSGTIKYIDQVRGYGNIVIVNHDKFFYSLYANLDEIFVKVDQKLKKGDKIGLIDVDLNAIKPYLYFEIRKQDTAVDPVLWLQN